MKTLKKILLYILIVWGTDAHGQSISFTYDDAGNMMKREVIILKSAIVSNPQDSLLVPEIEVEKMEQKKYEEDLGKTKIKIYPNPTMGDLNIELSGISDSSIIKIYLVNLNGKILQVKEKWEPSTSIKLNTYSSGAYILKILIDGAMKDWIVIKE